MDSPGRDAIHPDVTALLATKLTEWASHGDVATEQIAVLQQRTLYGADTPMDFTVAESAGLALLRRPGEREVILVFLCVRREPEGEWNLAGLTTHALPTAKAMPHAGGALLGPGRAIFGSVVISPEIGGVRATLAGGSQYEDVTRDRSFLLFAPLRTQQEKEEPITVRIFDRAGGAVSVEQYRIP